MWRRTRKVDVRKAIICSCVAGVFIFTLIPVAQADEILGRESQIKAIQKQLELQSKRMQEQVKQIQIQNQQIEDQKGQIAAMQRKIQKLESERASKIRTPMEMEERVIALEEKLKRLYEGGLLSLKGEKWEIGGELEFEFVDTKKHASVDEPEPHFQLDKLMLIPRVSLSEDIYLYGEIEFYTSSLLAKYIYAHFGNLPFNSFLRVGFDQKFMKPSRKTERYPLAGNAFWRDNSAGIYAGGEFKPLYWRFSCTNGFEINQRQITEDDSLDMLHDNLRTNNYDSPGELGLGLGFKKDFERGGKIDLLGFSYFSRLSGADETFLKSNVTGYNSDERSQYRYGLNLNYSVLGASLFTQFIKAKDGDLDRLSWYIQPSYKIKLADRDFFFAIEPLFRYGKLSLNIDAVTGDSLTWDREEFTFAVITDIYKNIKLKTEYTIDRMDKDAGGTKNYSEFVAQLEVKF